MPDHQITADPLDTYSGTERLLRDEIERRLFTFTVKVQAGLPIAGTLPLANEIVEAVRKHDRKHRNH